MGTINQDEIYTATQMVRNFSTIMTSISKGEKKQAFIVKNSKFEAVLLSMKEFERMKEAVLILEKIYTKKQKNGN
ncbi:MAG: prevent-host-death protein [Campylobacteraceae bacterium]|nr:prevent-host-death protein [Campylobacteraceae bacterium]